MGETYIWFAWRPVKLSVYIRGVWMPVNRWAWFRRVIVVKTIWADTFYKENN